MTPELTTDRLVLRGFRAGDLEAMTGFFADEDATRFVGGVAARPRVHTILSAFAGHWALFGLGQWAVEEKASGDLAGFVGHINPPDWPEPEIGWTIFPAFQGRGYATEASQAARAAIVRLGGPERLVSYISDANHASIGVARKLGAVAEEPVSLRGEALRVHRHPAIAREIA